MQNMQNDSLFVKTQADVATAFGVSTRSVAKWMQGGAPTKTKNGYDITAIARWRGIKVGDDKTEDKNSKNYWEKKFRKYRALHTKTLYEKERGELITVKEFEGRITEILMSLANNLTIYEDRLPPQLEGKTKQEMREIIHKENNHFRMQYKPKAV